MIQNRDAVCSICHQPIKTVRGAVRLSEAPLVCRHCFGDQTYAATPRWGTLSSPVGAEPAQR
jgi:hypothetical protein